MVDADVREVARMVLQDALGVNYVVDPTVQGTITVQTSQPVPAEDLIPILDAVLRVNGAALVQEGDLFKVVPIDQAMISGVTPTIYPLPQAGTLGFGIRIVPLRFISVAEAARLLEPFAPPGGTIQMDPSRNLLILAGSPAELATLDDLVASFDVNWLAGMSFGLFPLTVAPAVDVAAELEGIFGGPEAGPAAGVVRFLPIERLNAILVVSAQPEYVDRARTWITRLDRIGDGERPQVYVYPVQNGRAADLAGVLSETFNIESRHGRPLGFARAGSGAGGHRLERVCARRQRGRDRGGAGDRRTSRHAPRAARGAGHGHRTANAGRSRVRVRRGGSHRRRRDHELPDRPRQPASVQGDRIGAPAARHHTPSGSDRGDDRRGHSRRSAALRGRMVLPLWRRVVHVQHRSLRHLANLEALAPPAAGFTALFSNADVRAVFNALEDETDVNVISSPQLMVLDNQTARLQVGDQVPIATQAAVSVTDPDAPQVNTIEQRDTGVILSVTPRVNASGLVIMEIDEETSDPVRTVTSDINSPTIRQRRVASTVAVQSGQTVVLGGLIRDDRQRQQTGVPILQRLPIIGPLFGVTDNSTMRTELLVVITPRVIRSPDQARAVTEELRQRLRGLAPLEIKVR